MPASPRVTSTYATDFPWPVHRATALAAPYSMSSGWATTASAVSQSSGSGARLIGTPSSALMNAIGIFEADRLARERRDAPARLHRVGDRTERVAEERCAGVEIGDGARDAEEPRGLRIRGRLDRRRDELDDDFARAYEGLPHTGRASSRTRRTSKPAATSASIVRASSTDHTTT